MTYPQTAPRMESATATRPKGCRNRRVEAHGAMIAHDHAISQKCSHHQFFETAKNITVLSYILKFRTNPRCCGGLFAPWSGCAYCTDRPPSEGPWRAGHHRAQEGTLSPIKHTTLRRRVSCSHSCARTCLIPSY